MLSKKVLFYLTNFTEKLAILSIWSTTGMWGWIRESVRDSQGSCRVRGSEVWAAGQLGAPQGSRGLGKADHGPGAGRDSLDGEAAKAGQMELAASGPWEVGVHMDLIPGHLCQLFVSVSACVSQNLFVSPFKIWYWRKKCISRHCACCTWSQETCNLVREASRDLLLMEP